ncbi:MULTISPECIES: ABC transporter ATP-binding protein [Leptospira]|uniref:ABC transporter, ATP-binding protein n=4 Tax=Leptospira weilii TaxID=28184 RepID=A0A828Z1G2_9LEPT|nr:MULTISPECIES: ABC transporter ATP-binding protein [Leptospira]EMM73461.1 ABC transporter, ATP-binding protein [Leptospira weilii str. 2006001855]EMY14519.1 ABC transporter, ATP-binding protein [Leptospira weilii str. Ecochallenge]EKR65066.1 ABC transporter, ATP-binding protein [Leptospira weilii str. 2006001853]EMJ63685.1 ABC transporter, ATP-binding protein [Leptospira sp. P2653]EMN87865.1 ABC transporter, ATP-binding protein [Leptospira weilii str. UI 13098]
MKPKTKSSIVSVNNLSKFYANGFQALKNVSLEIQDGEIIALLGPNGAGKTTLISIICGIVNPSEGSVRVSGKDILKDFRFTRSQIGLVPQELSVHAFESVWATVNFTRGLYGKPPNSDYIEELLKSLSLWEKKDHMILTLSGGMKRRVLIAKALAHEPRILFLDEPTAGVDVELRKDMWNIVRNLRENGVTIILTTHYIEEAEEIADRIGVINKGELILVEDKKELMQKLGKKQLLIDLTQTLKKIPTTLKTKGLEVVGNGKQLLYTYDSHGKQTGISALLQDLKKAKIEFKDLNTTQSSLEEIFVQLVRESQ